MKYELEQIVFYMADNKICGAPILARMYMDNLHVSGTFYVTCHGLLEEENVFASKSELLDSIK